jgi:thiol-disulfide isomerase/thioredoxin
MTLETTDLNTDSRFFRHCGRCLLFFALLVPAALQSAWKTGDEVPDFGQYALEGDPLPDLVGKIVLIDFWATWCGPCKASFPVMIDLAKRFGPENFIILAVSVDKKAAPFEVWRKRYGEHLVMLRDVDQRLVSQAAIEAMPTSFLIDPSGRIVSRHSGFHSGETEALYEREIRALLDKAAD